MYDLDILNPDWEDDEDEDEYGSEILLAQGYNPDASEACEIAGELRNEGYSPSEALREGWRIAKGEDNPEFVPSPLLTALVFAGLAVLAYKAWKKIWPWQALGLARRQLARPAIRRPRPANPGTVMTAMSPNQLGRSFAPARPQASGVGSLSLVGGSAQGNARSELWPRAV